MKIFHALSLLMGYNSLVNVNAEVDCETGYKRIDSNENFVAGRKMMYKTFFDTCQGIGNCNYESEGCGLFDLDDDQAFGQGVTLKGEYTMDFGGKYKEQKPFQTLASACSNVGGMIACLDGSFNFIGDRANFDFLKGIGPELLRGKTLDTDVEVKIVSYPVCLPPSCQGKPLETVLYKASKELLLASPLVQMELSDSDEDMVMSLDLESMCKLANIERCEISVNAAMCGITEIAG